MRGQASSSSFVNAIGRENLEFSVEGQVQHRNFVTEVLPLLSINQDFHPSKMKPHDDDQDVDKRK